jgi:hypothetical protein
MRSCFRTAMRSQIQTTFPTPRAPAARLSDRMAVRLSDRQAVDSLGGPLALWGAFRAPSANHGSGGGGVKEIAPLDAQTGSNKYTFSCIKNSGIWLRIVRRPQAPPQRTRHREAHIRALASLMVSRGGGLSGAGQRYPRSRARSAGRTCLRNAKR